MKWTCSLKAPNAIACDAHAWISSEKNMLTLLNVRAPKSYPEHHDADPNRCRADPAARISDTNAVTTFCPPDRDRPCWSRTRNASLVMDLPK